MYKNLSPLALGIFGRHGEMLEIALTHRFKGLELDITEVVKRAQTTSVAQACKYLASAKITIGGFELPVRWAGEEAEFQADLAQLPTLLEVASALSADRCWTTIRPTSEQLPFHENFQFHVKRLAKLADALAPAGIKLGLDLQAAPAQRADGGFQFIYQADPLIQLIGSVGRDNIGVVVDTWSWTVGGTEAEKLRVLRAEQMVSVRLSDIPAGTDLAAITDEQRVMPGEGGTIDSSTWISTLEEVGYDGPVAIALHPSQVKGQKREAVITKASTVLDSLLNLTAAADAGKALAEAK
ncbi:MAG: sugar phosphate isomerase/epimerase [Pirellulaceae bacterium]|nr:sugar phosphate isomerase/epimerase [Pirellulaceae bacterium]